MKQVTKRQRYDKVDYVIWLILTLVMLIIFIPFWNAMVVSFQSLADYSAKPWALWPQHISLENYKAVFTEGAIANGYRSTLVVSLGTTLYAMFLNTTLAFVFSREAKDLPGKRFFFLLIMVPMFIGGGLVPTYLLMKNLGLVNSHLGLILMSGASTYNIIIMRNGFEESRPLEEAAIIDGANDITMFVRVLLPLQKPFIATFSLFTLVGAWNAYYWPNILLNSMDKLTLQQVLRSIIVTASTKANESGASADAMDARLFSEGIKMASVFVTMAPIMVVYPFLQKYFAKGVMVGAIKM